MHHSLRWQWFDHSDKLPSLTWVCGLISCQDLNLTNLSINQKVTSFFFLSKYIFVLKIANRITPIIYLDRHACEFIIFIYELGFSDAF